MRDTEREVETQAEREAEREKQASCREPDMGLNHRSPGSHPGSKAGAKSLTHPGIPSIQFLMSVYSGHDLRAMRFSPASGFLLSGESASPSPSAPPPEREQAHAHKCTHTLYTHVHARTYSLSLK